MESIQRLGMPVVLCFMLAGCAEDVGTQYMSSLQQYGCARGGGSQCARPVSHRPDKADTVTRPNQYQSSASDASYTP